MDPHQVMSCALLMLVSVAYSQALLRIERLRLAVTAGKVPAIHGAWVFAGAILLSPIPLLALVAVVYLGDWPARRIVMSAHPGRYVYSAGAAGLAALAASAVAHAAPAAYGVPVAIATFCLTSAGLIAAAIIAARQFAVLKMFCSASSQLVEVGTISGGALLALGMHWTPAAALAAAPVLAVLHRSSLRDVVRSTRAYDPRTGLWSEVAWRAQGMQLLADSGSSYVALFIIDPEAPGQEAAIVAGLGRGVERHLGPRGGDTAARDLVGQYGTRQVAVLMNVGPASAGRLFMERIQANLTQAGIAATMGVAVTADQEMEELIMDSVSDLMRRRELAGVENQW